VFLLLLLVIVLAFAAYRATTASERAAFAKWLRLLVQRWQSDAAEWFDMHAPFFQVLRARTPVAPVTPVLAVLNIAMFLVMLVAGIAGGHDGLVEWGASIGPRTTNGEWWRLVTSLFVHAGAMHLLASLVGFVPLGFVLERLVGSVALAAVYVTCGVFAGLASASADPLAVNAGASGAIFGMYGLGIATMAWGLLQRPRMVVPRGVLKLLGWSALVFLVYNIPSGLVVLRAELTALVAGALCGAVMGAGVGAHLVPGRRSAAMVTAALVITIAAAVRLHGMTDVRPDIERMRATDERTAATFRAAATQFALGRTNEKAMVTLIEREIIPALQREQPSLDSGARVPDDQQALKADASVYLRLRIESWRLRAAAFRKASMATLRQAEIKEAAARDLLVRIPSR
jgi:membrane associated rhomboid family serine protease